MDEMNRKDPLSNEENIPEEILEAAQQTDPVEEQTDSLDLTEPSEESDEAVSQEEETSTHELTEEGQEADELEEENEPEEEIDAEEEERYLLRLARHRRIRKISLIAVAGAIVVVLLAWLIVWRVTTVDPNATAITVGGEKVSISEYAFQYFTSVDYYVSNNSSNLTELGLNVEGDLREQPCGIEGYEDKTWHDYFVEQTDLALQSTVALASEAKKAGLTVDNFPEIAESIEQYITSIDTYATQYGLTKEQLIETNYGGLCTEESIRSALERVFLAQAYMGQKLGSYEFSDEEIQAFYDENKRSLDTVSYRVMIFSDATSSDTTAESESSSSESSEAQDSEASESSEVSEAQDELAGLTAQEKAEKMLSEITDEQSFIDASVKYCDPDKVESYQDGSATLSTGIYASQFNETAAADWLFDEARQPGDVTILDLQAGYAVTYFIERTPDESYTVDIRHALIGFEKDDEGNVSDENKEAAKSKAEQLYQEWLSGDKTEESFAEMAKSNSTDGNAAEGGLYENVYTGQMVETFNDWCFDPSRQTGDSGIVETKYGYHIMYFVGKSGPAWKENSLAILQNQQYAEYEDGILEEYPVTDHGDVLNKITR